MRLRVETALATVTAVLAAATLVWGDWIEIIFGIDPDRHDGSLEWLVVAGLAVIAIALSLSARRTWRRATLPAG